jgi:outer membrane protein TolC
MESQTPSADPAVQSASSRSTPAHAVLVALTLAACATRSYAPEPLLPAHFATVAEERAAAGANPSDSPPSELTLAIAAEWLRTRGPRVREVVAAYRTALARAGVATPWPNPSLAVGSELGFGSAVDVNKVVPFASLGFTLPLSGRLGRQDELNQALAEAARADALAAFRELYLELRVRYLRLAVAKRREAVRSSLLDAASASLDATNDLVAAGAATALDVSLFRLEHARERSRSLGAQLEGANAASDLSDLVAVSPERLGVLPEVALPAPPGDVPEWQVLQELIVKEHPCLFRLRAEYRVAEQQLQLEISKQYPDLVFGSAFGGETGEHKTVLGLSLGIELPLFDRNQQAIAEAHERRDEVRTRFESEAQRVLAAVERARGGHRGERRHRGLRRSADACAPRPRYRSEATAA